MKKMLIISMMLMISLICFTQTHSLNYSQTRAFGNVSDEDTLTNKTTDTDSTVSYSCYKDTDKKPTITIGIKLDSISGTPANVNVFIYDKMYPFEEYVIRDTITWYVSENDTIIRYEKTEDREPYIKWETVGSDATFHYQVKNYEFKYQ